MAITVTALYGSWRDRDWDVFPQTGGKDVGPVILGRPWKQFAPPSSSPFQLGRELTAWVTPSER